MRHLFSKDFLMKGILTIILFSPICIGAQSVDSFSGYYTRSTFFFNNNKVAKGYIIFPYKKTLKQSVQFIPDSLGLLLSIEKKTDNLVEYNESDDYVSLYFNQNIDSAKVGLDFYKQIVFNTDLAKDFSKEYFSGRKSILAKQLITSVKWNLYESLGYLDTTEVLCRFVIDDQNKMLYATHEYMAIKPLYILFKDYPPISKKIRRKNKGYKYFDDIANIIREYNSFFKF